jgi:hypothetical protein
MLIYRKNLLNLSVKDDRFLLNAVSPIERHFFRTPSECAFLLPTHHLIGGGAKVMIANL